MKPLEPLKTASRSLLEHAATTILPSPSRPRFSQAFFSQSLSETRTFSTRGFPEKTLLSLSKSIPPSRVELQVHSKTVTRLNA
ncbi:MAG: hypothetical protein FGF53_02370 [Candidatus Brockarchaeota archaeon]|nr:hypothetical protein [Candidatus Brockarchaeota archaeon]